MCDPKWVNTMEEELNFVEKNQTWELVNVPHDMKPIALKWFYKAKVNPNGYVIKHKAILVAKGLLQKPRVDYGEVYAFVARIETI